MLPFEPVAFEPLSFSPFNWNPNLELEYFGFYTFGDLVFMVWGFRVYNTAVWAGAVGTMSFAFVSPGPRSQTTGTSTLNT